MFLKRNSQRNKDGTMREYVYLAKSVRQGKRVIQQTVASLGRLDELAKGDTFENLAKKFAEFSGKLDVLNLENDLLGEDSQEIGRVWAYRKLWEQLGFATIFKSRFADKHTQFDLSETLLALVTHRLTDPSSKRGMLNWKDGVYEPRWEALQLQHVYRAMDYLMEEKEAFEQAVFKNTVDLFSQKLDVVMLDSTSLVHWGDGAHSTLLKHGYSKDRRGDLRQIVVGVLMTQEGVPIAHEVFSGNQVDVKNFPKMIEQLKTKYAINEVVVVADKGMMSPDNMVDLHHKGYKFIVGVRLKGRSSEWVDPLVTAQGFAPIIRTDDKELDVKDIVRMETLEYDRDKRGRPQQSKELKLRYVVCHNLIRDKEQKERRAYFRKILLEKIPFSSVKSWFKQSGYRKYVKVKGDNIRLAVDEERLKDEEKFDGMWAVVTNWFDLPSRDIVTHYKGLRRVEDGFKSLKSDLEIGPMFHWTSNRIRAHVFVCFLALLLKIAFQKKVQATFPHLNVSDLLHDVKRLSVLRLTLPNKRVHLRSQLHGNAYKAFQALGVQPPPKFLKLEPINL